jgi:hypothetical protein
MTLLAGSLPVHLFGEKIMDASSFNVIVAHSVSSQPVVTPATQEVQAAFTEAAIVKAVAKVPANRIIGKVTVTPFQSNLFKIAFGQAEKVSKAQDNMQTVLKTALAMQYGDTAPTYKQFQADRAALKVLALEKGLVDDQYIRKAYNGAINGLYGALPVAMTEAAVAMREMREKMAAELRAKQEAALLAGTPVPKTLKTVGAPKGETIERNPNAGETIEQLIARVGIFATLNALTKILKTARETELDAKALQAMSQHYKK